MKHLWEVAHEVLMDGLEACTLRHGSLPFCHASEHTHDCAFRLLHELLDSMHGDIM